MACLIRSSKMARLPRAAANIGSFSGQVCKELSDSRRARADTREHDHRAAPPRKQFRPAPQSRGRHRRRRRAGHTGRRGGGRGSHLRRTGRRPSLRTDPNQFPTGSNRKAEHTAITRRSATARRSMRLQPKRSAPRSWSSPMTTSGCTPRTKICSDGSTRSTRTCSDATQRRHQRP